MGIIEKKWIYFNDNSLVPNGLYKSYNFIVFYFPDVKMLQVEDKSRYFDDHACIQFRADTLEDAEKILDSIISVQTV